LSSFLDNFYKFQIFGPNLKMQIRGKFANFKKIDGPIYYF